MGRPVDEPAPKVESEVIEPAEPELSWEQKQAHLAEVRALLARRHQR